MSNGANLICLSLGWRGVAHFTSLNEEQNTVKQIKMGIIESGPFSWFGQPGSTLNNILDLVFRHNQQAEKKKDIFTCMFCMEMFSQKEFDNMGNMLIGFPAESYRRGWIPLPVLNGKYEATASSETCICFTVCAKLASWAACFRKKYYQRLIF